MTIILSKEEQQELKEYLNCSELIKKVEFESSKIYIKKFSLFLLEFLLELFEEIPKSRRAGYKYDFKTKVLTFYDDF